MDNKLIIREYLTSLTEKGELNAIFPLLLTTMGFRLIVTPKEAIGQSEYGRDVVAIGKDNGIVHRYYFELKGGEARDINQQTFYDDDGIRMSLLEAKDTPFRDVGTPKFNSLPIKYVLVHNGVLKPNFRPTFNGFIDENFPDNIFERWDIHKLTELFDSYLFNEYLIPNQEDSRLLRRVLLLIDTPDYNFVDFIQLVQNLLSRIPLPKRKRRFVSAMATLLLLGSLVYHTCRQQNNLTPARECLSYLLLQTWAWVLRNKYEQDQQVVKWFRKLVFLHFDLLRNLIQKTSSIVSQKNGLFAEKGGPYEVIGYPIRCFDYLNYFLYYCEASSYFPLFNGNVNLPRRIRLERQHKRFVECLINANDGYKRLQIDANHITVAALVKFYLESEDLTQSDVNFLSKYIVETMDYIHLTKKIAGRYPLLSHNLDPLIEYAATGKRPFNYSDSTSLAIYYLYEILALLGADDYYKYALPLLETSVDLQIAYPCVEDYDIEQLLFERHLHDEYWVETSLNLPSDPDQLRSEISTRNIDSIDYRTDLAGFGFLRTLAHVYYKNEFFPDDWRKHLIQITSASMEEI